MEVFKLKKTIIITIIIGMFTWAIYDFVNKSNDTATPKANEYEISEETSTSTSNEGIKDFDTIGLQVGDTARDFELTTLDGENIKLSEFRGPRVMLNFWATWCPPCRAEMPDMQKFHENKNIVILAVNLIGTESSKENVVDFIEEFEISFPILLDTDMEISNLYRIQPIPTSYMIDSDGRIQYKAFGALNYELMVQEFEKMK